MKPVHLQGQPEAGTDNTHNNKQATVKILRHMMFDRRTIFNKFA